MIVRRLVSGDELAPAIALLQRFFREEGFATSNDVIAQRTQILASLETCLLLVAEKDGVAIGVATLSSEFGIEYGWWAELGDLYVVPPERGQGIAQALIAAA